MSRANSRCRTLWLESKNPPWLSPLDCFSSAPIDSGRQIAVDRYPGCIWQCHVQPSMKRMAVRASSLAILCLVWGPMSEYLDVFFRMRVLVVSEQSRLLSTMLVLSACCLSCIRSSRFSSCPGCLPVPIDHFTPRRHSIFQTLSNTKRSSSEVELIRIIPSFLNFRLSTFIHSCIFIVS